MLTSTSGTKLTFLAEELLACLYRYSLADFFTAWTISFSGASPNTSCSSSSVSFGWPSALNVSTNKRNRSTCPMASFLSFSSSVDLLRD